jgi:hypothetical protein
MRFNIKEVSLLVQRHAVRCRLASVISIASFACAPGCSARSIPPEQGQSNLGDTPTAAGGVAPLPEGSAPSPEAAQDGATRDLGVPVSIDRSVDETHPPGTPAANGMLTPASGAEPATAAETQGTGAGGAGAMASPKFHVFLLLGQSNMAGYPKAQPADRAEEPRI